MSYNPQEGENYILQEIQIIQIRFFLLGFLFALIVIGTLYVISNSYDNENVINDSYKKTIKPSLR